MRFILFILVLIAAIFTQAQTTQKIKIDENTLVTDSSGTVYPYKIWTQLLATGQYNLKMKNSTAPNDGMILVRLTEKEIKQREENAPKPNESKFFTTGKQFRNFKLKDINGNKYNLKDLVGKVVVLNFWFINCGPCRTEIPQLNNTVKEFQSADVIFLAVALDDYSQLQEFLKTTPFHYNIVDDGRWFASNNGVTSYPTHVVIDKEGKIVYHTSGLSKGTVAWLKKAIKESLAK